MTPLNLTNKNPIGFLFPGQGPQKIGMGHDVEANFPLASKYFDRAHHHLGFSIRDLCMKGPEVLLNQDVNAQLALYTISCIITGILENENISPHVCIGYSSGFYAAAYAAGCFDFTSGLSIVKNAGELLLEEGKQIDGGMAVIFGLPVDHVRNILQKVKHVEIAILNTPRQIVVSGINAHIKDVMDIAVEEGALDARPLPVATAYHSRFMAAAGRRFLKAMKNKTFSKPRLPLFSYTTLAPIEDAGSLCETMAYQLSRPVLWVDLIKKLRHKNVRRMVEIGTGAMLSRTVRWIDRTITMMNTDTADGTKRVIKALTQS
jgi:malonyl CoA-acyl carrier protein transacylase